MYVLRIEHAVASYDGWKKAFDSDPAGRQRSGVRRYRIMRPVDEPHRVLIDLELDTRSEAENLLAALRTVWGRVEGTVMTGAPEAQVVETVETAQY